MRGPVLLELPARLVIPTVVHKLARVTESAVTRLLPILAEIGLIVEPARGRRKRRVRWALPDVTNRDKNHKTRTPLHGACTRFKTEDVKRGARQGK